MKIVAIALLFLLVAGALCAEEIQYPINPDVVEAVKWISVGAFVGWTVGIIIVGIIAPDPTEWRIINDEWVRVE